MIIKLFEELKSDMHIGTKKEKIDFMMSSLDSSRIKNQNKEIEKYKYLYNQAVEDLNF